jgi:hypothetical protein
MTYNELLEYWKNGAKIEYRYLRYTRQIGAYDETKEDNLKALFYRQGVKFKVLK